MWFELQDNAGGIVATWGADRSAGQEGPVVVLEECKYGLVVHDANPTDEYALKVGDEDFAVEQQRFQPTVCHLLQEAYFESASGRSTLSVMLSSGEGMTRELGSFEFFVLPSKIGRENYAQMVADLQTICRSLVNDLVGKSRHSTVWKNQLRSRMYRSHEEDLRSVERTWHDLRPLLSEIEHSPALSVGGRSVLMACARNRSMRNLPVMMKRGIDPRNPVPGRKCRLTRIALSADTPEHRMIRGFLQVLSARLKKCREGLEREIRAIMDDKRYRFRANLDGTPSLYEIEDMPRLAKLRAHAESVVELQQDIASLMTSDFWRRAGTSSDLPSRVQFCGNRYYMQAAGIILAYLRNGFNYVPETGDDFTTKKTSRLYEQWMIVQLVAAFEACGVEIDTWDSVVQKSIDRQFGMDFGRNTRFTARIGKDYVLCVRYQPWILPRSMVAEHQEETLCHGGNEDSFWSPDCVIELQCLEHGRLQAVYAVVLDAKYSRSPQKEMRESVAKYQRIRTNGVGRGVQIAHQVWVVFTGRDDMSPGISIDDESLTFSENSGPVDAETFEGVGTEEWIHGDIVARPTDKSNLGEKREIRGVVLNDVIFKFAKGTLAYFRKIMEEGGE